MINNEIDKTKDHIYGKNQIDEASLTDFYGIDKEINIVDKFDS